MRSVLLALGALTLAAAGAWAQPAASASFRLESAGIAGGGRTANSAGFQAVAVLGQSSWLAAPNESVSNASFAMQPGLSPTLYPRTLRGDSNSDGVRNAADAVRSVNIGNGSQPVPTNIIQFFNADANTSGSVTAADVTAVVDLILGQ